MSSIRRINRLRSLSYSEWCLLFESALLLGLVKAGLLVLPFKTMRRLLKIDLEADPETKSADSGYEKKVVWAIEALCSRLPIFKNCLNRALATQLMLRKSGREAQLLIGVTRGPQGKFEAHAWLERDGKIVIGTLPDLRSYTPLRSFQRKVL